MSTFTDKDTSADAIDLPEVIGQNQEQELTVEDTALVQELKAKFGLDVYKEEKVEENQPVKAKENKSPEENVEAIKADIKAKELVDQPTEAEKEEKTEEKQEVKPQSGPIEFKEYIASLPEGTKVKHKIDGKEVEIDVKEAVKKVLNDYSGYETVEKRFTALDKEKKMYYNEKQQIESYISEFGNRVKDGHILGGLEYFGQFAGLPPHVIKEQLIAALTPEIERRYGLDQRELENEYLKAELEYKSQLESEAKQRSQKQAAAAELEDKVNRLRETHGIDEESWAKAFNELDSTIPPGQPITPEMVAAHATIKPQDNKVVQVAETLVKKFELSDADKNVIVDTMKQYPNLSEKDVEELIKESLEIQAKQETEKKLAEKLGNKQSTKEPAKEEALQDDEIKRLKRLAGVISPWE